jgi:DNA (cytosine-5)-methyltransferase 1
MTCKWQIEIDDYATKVLEKHWPEVKRYRDIKELSGTELEPVDMIAAGFPCTNITNAGIKDGIKGKHSSLFFEVVRIVRNLEPRFVLLENVSPLVVRGLGEVVGSMASIGYDSQWHCIPASDPIFGAPHRRERIFIFSYQSQVTSDSSGPRSTPWIPEKRYREEGSAKEPDDYSDRRARWPGKGYWAVEPELGRLADGIPNRVHRLKCLGNAVVPQVAEFLGRRILEYAKIS